MANPFSQIHTVHVRDVTLRDGLQSVPPVLPLTDKLRVFQALTRAGVRELQVTSFVNPARLPQLGDAEALWSTLSGRPERLNVLVANLRGYERAVRAGALDIEAVLAASETYSQKNANRSREQALQEVLDMLGRAEGDGARVCVALANSFHCVYEGDIDPALVMGLLHRLAESGAREVMLCDTTGHAHPQAVHALFERARRELPHVRFGAHLHDTRGRGLTNALAALLAGVDWLDAALAGLGGSPFAKGVGGNLSLERLVEMLDGMHVHTGIRLPEAEKAAELVTGLTHQPAVSV